ncbi:kinase-like protein [Backusella circina FSU 941]|nr:kinase-like protein [Backusella circina FSU 941]
MGPNTIHVLYCSQFYRTYIIEYCQERGLKADGTKAELIDRLIEWKKNVRAIPAPSTPRLYTALELLPDSSCTLPPQDRYELNSRDLSALFLDDSKDQDIPYSALTMGQKLGSGGFKDCYVGSYKGEPVAIGELRLTQFNAVDIKEIKHEIKVLKQLRHENVIRFIGVCTHPQHLCIITELCAKGDLFDVIRNYKKPSFSQLVMYMYDIALGVSYLHTRR